MKQSILKPKKDQKKNAKSKTKVNNEEEPITKIKNEIFRKLCERNNSSKGRLKTINYDIPNHRSDYKTPRSTSNFRNSRNINSNIKSQQKKEISNPPVKTKSKKILRPRYNPRNYKAYPNLIGGILHQVNYYNINNNNNYNDYLRYKPIDDIFNEQSSISPKREKDNNNNSPNLSFNSENQNDDKNNFNNRGDDIDNNDNDNNDNTNDNIYNNYNIENEMKVNPENLNNRKSGEIIEKNGRTISPIISSVSSYNNKKDNNINDLIGKYVDINPPPKNDDENNNNQMNEKDIKNLNLKYKNKKKHLTPNQFNPEPSRRGEKRPSRDEAYKRKINSFKIVKTNQLSVNKDNDKPNPNQNIKLKESPQNIFSIYNKPKNENKENKKNNFDNLKRIKSNDINIIVPNLKTNKSKPILNDKNNEGKLTFDNEDQVLYYVKKRMQEEKDREYNNDKPIYNYFILTKKFHGRLLYEIGLENDINYINSILDKEKVEIEHEPVAFIKKRELYNLKRNNYNNNTNNDEIEKLKKENDKLKNRLDLIKGDKDSNLVNKLLEEIDKLKEKNKNLEDDIYNKQYLINQYDVKIKNYNKILDDNKILQDDKDKFTKYIYELQEYNEKVILEYQKLKQQLELEKQNKNNNDNNNNYNYKPKKYFSNYELSINTNDAFDIINRKIYKKREKKNYYNYGIYGDNNREEENEEEIEEENGDENEEEEYEKKRVENDEDEKAKRQERMNRALKRVNNRRKMMDKEWAEKNKFRKSEKIQGMAGELEGRLKYVEGRSFAD